MNKKYYLNTLLAAVLGLYLLWAVVARAFFPWFIQPKAELPNLVLLCLVTLVLEHYIAPDAQRCYICIPVLAALTFGLLPWAAAMVAPLAALKLGLMGGVTFTVTTWLFSTIQDRLSSGPAAKASAFFSAVSLYMASQCLMGLFNL